MAKKSQKGSSFEREISKLLSLWWSEGERDDVFWRSSQSGGRATTRAKMGKATAGSYGDITALHVSGEPFTNFFCVELKRGYTKDTDVMALLDSKQKEPILLQHWNQCERDRCAAEAAHSLVIIKRDHMTTCVYVSTELFELLQANTLGKFKKGFIKYTGEIRKSSVSLVMMKLEDFLKWAKPKRIKKWMKTIQK